jgi:DNA processing protein
VITRIDPEYPPMLLEIPDPPLVLHFRGNASLLARPGVAMVGSRRASPYAINAANHLAAQIASTGLTVVSGLARGIDAASHVAALDAGGTTIAVLGTGIDLTYPRSHARLFRRIEAEGVIVSEFPPGTPPRSGNFPIRNRIISA